MCVLDGFILIWKTADLGGIEEQGFVEEKK